jgi:hypothetical protein
VNLNKQAGETGKSTHIAENAEANTFYFFFYPHVTEKGLLQLGMKRRKDVVK